MPPESSGIILAEGGAGARGLGGGGFLVVGGDFAGVRLVGVSIQSPARPAEAGCVNEESLLNPVWSISVAQQVVHNQT